MSKQHKQRTHAPDLSYFAELTRKDGSTFTVYYSDLIAFGHKIVDRTLTLSRLLRSPSVDPLSAAQIKAEVSALAGG
jgi:hypothetical protein